MIEFDGYLSGSAETRFFKKARDYGQTALLVGGILALPIAGVLGRQLQTWIPIGVCFAVLLSIPLLVRIPMSKKEKKASTPKKIYIEEGSITCVTDRYTETRSISDVKEVLDHGEFYELVFYFGKLSEKFICQKNLLTKGSLEEFEQLFEGKFNQ